MTKISINSPGGGSSSPGSLQLENGDAMDSTLRYVTDTSNTKSKLLLSDTDTRVEGSLVVDGGAATPRVIIDADTNVARILSIRTNDLPRWALRVDDTESGSNAGSNFAIRRYNDAGVFIDAPFAINRANGRVSILERLLLEADSTATTQSTAVLQNPTTNSGIAIVPSGTGAITAAIPDGTSTGGNARGANAVDLQMVRSSSNQVASGQSSFQSGENNRTTGLRGVTFGQDNINSTGRNGVTIGQQNNNSGVNSFAGGYNSTVSAAESFSFGNGNSVSGAYAIAVGGQSNNVSSTNGSVLGGSSNTASTNTHATVVGGFSNTSSGSNSVSGGQSNTASGGNSVALGNNNISSSRNAISIGERNTTNQTETYAIGYENTVSSQYGAAIGANNTVSNSIRNYAFGFQNTSNSSTGQSLAIGFNCIASAQHAITLGFLSRSYIYGQLSFANGVFSTVADSQQSTAISRREATLTTTQTTILSTDGTGVTGLLIPFGNNRSWNVVIDYVAVVTAITGTATGVSVGDTKTQGIVLGFKRLGGVSSIVGAPGSTYTNEDASMATALLTPTAGASQQLQLTFTSPSYAGGGSVTYRIVARVKLVEVAW